METTRYLSSDALTFNREKLLENSDKFEGAFIRWKEKGLSYGESALMAGLEIWMRVVNYTVDNMQRLDDQVIEDRMDMMGLEKTTMAGLQPGELVVAIPNSLLSTQSGDYLDLPEVNILQKSDKQAAEGFEAVKQVTPSLLIEWPTNEEFTLPDGKLTHTKAAYYFMALLDAFDNNEAVIKLDDGRVGEEREAWFKSSFVYWMKDFDLANAASGNA